MKKWVVGLCLFASVAYADSFSCKVVHISDGDTVRCLTKDKKQLKIRLYQIDAPESGQDYGQKSRQALARMVGGQKVDVRSFGKDQYNRVLGQLTVVNLHGCCSGEGPQAVCTTCDSSFDVNRRMIEEGYAWSYPFTKKNPAYRAAQETARQARQGLWQAADPVEPWVWRRRRP